MPFTPSVAAAVMRTPFEQLALFGAPSGGEILLVLLVILLLFGSKNLPGMARTLGKTLESFRRAAREVSDEIMHADADEPHVPPKLPHAVPREGEEEGKDEAPS
jgi:sec-independent protein translocase protein TatA